MLGTPFSFARHGQAGINLSEVWKHLPGVIDEFAVIKSVQTDQFNHAPAQLYLHTGTPQFGGASIGSWATYGLGSENQDLPGFVVLTSGGKTPTRARASGEAAFCPRRIKAFRCGPAESRFSICRHRRASHRAGRSARSRRSGP